MSSTSSSSRQNSTFTFPSLSNEVSKADVNAVGGDLSEGTISPVYDSRKTDLWQTRRKNLNGWPNGGHGLGARRTRQKSLSEALMTIQNRRASISDNAHEIAEALKAPVSLKLIMLCGVWYMTSIFSNASSKSILIAFRQPVTLTLVQFAFVSSWCVLCSYMAHLYPSICNIVPALRYPIRRPTKELIIITLPLTAFQIGGHILNSDAMARIPVSLVHTIKGLSPLFTVLAYRIFFRIHYSVPTYLSLFPLTLGVVMACSANPSGNLVGLTFAFGSALLFVTQNIVSKRLFNEAARAESDGLQEHLAAKKPDKLNLLCYSSGLAFIFTLPIWLWSEAPLLFRDVLHDGVVDLADRPDALDHGRLAVEFIFNGSFHFAQSLVAFILLSMVSPVTYSVASLIKRVFVILFSIAWFGNPMTRIQAAGIALTFLGLYLYDRTNDRADRRTKLALGVGHAPLLPLIAEDKKYEAPPVFSPTRVQPFASPVDMAGGAGLPLTETPTANRFKAEDRRLDQVAFKRSTSPREPGRIQPSEPLHDDSTLQPNGVTV